MTTTEPCGGTSGKYNVHVLSVLYCISGYKYILYFSLVPRPRGNEATSTLASFPGHVGTRLQVLSLIPRPRGNEATST